MAFRFRLQSVLRHRQYLQELAMSKLAVKLKAQREAEQHIDWLGEELRRARAELGQREISGMPAKDFVLANEYVTVLRLMALREMARLPGLEAETEEARGELTLARRASKVLENLRQRHLDAYLHQQLKNEQRVLDEVAVSGYLRRQNS